MHQNTRKYNQALDPKDRDICDQLALEIDKYLPEAENKIWHAHPFPYGVAGAVNSSWSQRRATTGPG